MDAARLAALLDRADRGDRAAAEQLFAAAGAAELAAAIGGALGFRFACAELTYLIERAAEVPDDRVRERYSALLDLHRDEPARLSVLRPFGERIHQLEREGVLPRSMVVRPPRRR